MKNRIWITVALQDAVRRLAVPKSMGRLVDAVYADARYLTGLQRAQVRQLECQVLAQDEGVVCDFWSSFFESLHQDAVNTPRLNPDHRQSATWHLEKCWKCQAVRRMLL